MRDQLKNISEKEWKLAKDRQWHKWEDNTKRRMKSSLRVKVYNQDKRWTAVCISVQQRQEMSWLYTWLMSWLYTLNSSLCQSVQRRQEMDEQQSVSECTTKTRDGWTAVYVRVYNQDKRHRVLDICWSQLS